jgi:hypothetical protein
MFKVNLVAERKDLTKYPQDLITLDIDKDLFRKEYVLGEFYLLKEIRSISYQGKIGLK